MFPVSIKSKKNHWIVLFTLSLSFSAHSQHIGRLPAIVFESKSPLSSLPPPTPVPGPANNSGTQLDIAKLTQREKTPFSGITTVEATIRAANEFVISNAKELGIDNNAAEFLVRSARPSPNGGLINLEQRVNGIRILDTNIAIKVGPNGNLERVARNIVDIPSNKSGEIRTEGLIDATEAQKIAWQDLHVVGELMETPTVEKAYQAEFNSLTLVYVVKLAVSDPFGYWEYKINAETSEIISKADRGQRRKNGSPEGELISITNPQPSVSLSNALKVLAAKESLRFSLANKNFNLTAPPTATMATVFSSNPITATKSNVLSNGDPPEKFEQAYKRVQLKGLEWNDGRFVLQNHVLSIKDFEPGENNRWMAPSTTVKEWIARRGDNAFNDVMTYYHLMSGIDYLRTLGYKGSAELFVKGLAVDSDGMRGKDDSQYVPGSDRISFGHGCVDDNEDSDVIMHELGHAIHYHLNSAWGGGDSGAIGEGFGDYWAVSTRLRMPDGLIYDPGKVFLWDGNGRDSCWNGRRVDRKNARYSSTKNYRPHSPEDGFVSDELWSTPLVSSLKELVAAGESVESVDLVILDGMEGIGRDFTMSDVAIHTIKQARLRYPNKPHASVLEKNFRLHGILK